MKGVSEVIAIILILMITIAIAGLAYTFMSSTMSSTTSAASSAVDTTTAGMMTSFVIESMYDNKIYIRNTGQSAISNMSVYVNDEPAIYDITPGMIAAGQVGTVTINQNLFRDSKIKILSPSGLASEKHVQNDYYDAVGYWKLDEGYNAYANDSSLYRNDGIVTDGGANGTATWTIGRFGGAIEFWTNTSGARGGVDYVRIPNSTSLNISGPLTISAWIYPVSTANIIFIFDKRVGSNDGYTLRYDNGNAYFAVGNGTTYVGSTKAAPINQWNHVVGLFNETHVTVFVNTVQGTINSFNGRMPGNKGYPTIGTANYFEYQFNGTIDDVAIWNRTLSSQEISSIYNKAIY